LDPFESFEVNEVLLIRPVVNAYLEGMCVGLFGGAVAQHLNEAFLVVQVPEVRVVDGNLAILEKFVHPWKKKEQSCICMSVFRETRHGNDSGCTGLCHLR